MAFNYYSLIENDLLSFIYSMGHLCTKSEILRHTSKFYSDEDIMEAHRTFFSTISFEALNQYRSKYKSSHPLVAIYNCITYINKDILPMIIYKSLENIPSFAHKTTKLLANKTIFIKNENGQTCHFDEADQGSEVEDEEDYQLNHYKKELEKMKFKITDVSAIVLQIKDQIDQVKERQQNYIPSKKAKMESIYRKRSCSVSSQEHSMDHELKETLQNKALDSDSAEDIVLITQPFNSWSAESSSIKDEDNAKSNERIIYIKDELTQHHNSPSHVNNSKKTVLEGEIDENCSDETETLIVDMSHPNTCDICDQSFSTSLELDSHMQTHPPRTEFKCILCGEIFRSRKDLRDHFLLCFKANEDRLLSDGLICTVCGRMYGDSAALQTHKNIHSESRPYQCPHCTYRYLTKKTLDSHIKTLHNKLNKFFCPFCHHSYISNNYLLVHIRSHTGEKPFSCDQCDYRSATQSMLAKHVLRHQVQEEYPCDLCDYVSRGADNLRSHKSKTHRNVLLKCRVCGKEFKNATIYKTHYLTHSGEKPFKCAICSYSGLTRATLASHMKIHSGSDLLFCPDCSMPFRTNFSFRRHLKTHTEEVK